MCGKFENVKLLTCTERTNKDGGKYYIYNILVNNFVYNIYSKEFFDYSVDDTYTIELELSFYRGNWNCKLVGVA